MSLVRAGCLFLVRTRTGRLVELRWGEGAPLTLILSPPSPSLRPSEKKIAP